jgi:3-phytase
MGLVLTTAMSVVAPASASHTVAEAPTFAETSPVRHSGDAADDPAIWVHPTDPDGWLVVGNNKRGALEVYDSSGARVQRIGYQGAFTGNVDIRGDIVAVARGGIRFYRVDPVARRLVDITDRAVRTRGEGLCLYDAGPRGLAGGLYAFTITRRDGRVRQYRIRDRDRDGLLGGKATGRDFTLGSEAEGCVAHHRTGRLFISEEDVAIWQYDADPSAGSRRVAIDRVGERLPTDVEGLTIAAGHLIASAQNVADPTQNWFNVYDVRTGRYVRSVRVGDGPLSDDCDRTDGIAASARVGLFVCQDGYNDTPGASGNQNFKYVPLRSIVP